jgi:hypothetical protein
MRNFPLYPSKMQSLLAAAAAQAVDLALLFPFCPLSLFDSGSSRQAQCQQCNRFFAFFEKTIVGQLIKN